MPEHSRVGVWIHMVWGTHDHEPILHRNLRVALFKHFVSLSEDLGIFIGKLNVQPDHVHMLFSIPADQSVSKTVKGFKGESSRWINENKYIDGTFRWQRGYGAFSVSASQLNKVKNYIENQNEHHRMKTFSEENKEWAQKYGVW